MGSRPRGRTSIALKATIPGLPTGAEAEWPMQRWVDKVMQSVTTDIAERAKQLAQQQMAPHEMMMRADTAFSVAMGVLTPEEAALPPEALLMESYRRHVLLELGQALSMLERDDEAARVLGAVAHRFTRDPDGRVQAANARLPDCAKDPRCRHFEREVFQHWAVAVKRIGRGQEELVHRYAARRGLWHTHLQRPLDHYHPALRARAFWDTSELPAARALEAAF